MMPTIAHFQISSSSALWATVGRREPKTPSTKNPPPPLRGTVEFCGGHAGEKFTPHHAADFRMGGTDKFAS